MQPTRHGDKTWRQDMPMQPTRHADKQDMPTRHADSRAADKTCRQRRRWMQATRHGDKTCRQDMATRHGDKDVVGCSRQDIFRFFTNNRQVLPIVALYSSRQDKTSLNAPDKTNPLSMHPTRHVLIVT